MGGGETLLLVENLTVTLATREGTIEPVLEVSFSVGRGEAVGLVGESGSGKTLTGLSLLGLFPAGAKPPQGRILFEGSDLLSLSPSRLREIRGQKISMVFQEPQSALNPVLTVATQMEEIYKSHTALPSSEIRGRILERLREAGLPDPLTVSRSYPHQLSGGMRQRVMIAMALALDPLLVIADEPTTALDPTVALQILALLSRIRKSSGQSLLFISHDLSHVRRVSDRVLLMYAGRIVEESRSPIFFSTGPRHPYGRALLASRPEGATLTRKDGPLAAIGGQVPPLWDLPEGCSFAPRCERADDLCRSVLPPWKSEGEGRVFCHHPVDTPLGAPVHAA
ncbi:MAG: ABC transporter ATP-binding protein [Leptospirillia bacterium]